MPGTPATPFRQAPCDYCPQQVIFGDTGKTLMPVDPQPVPEGNIVLLPRPMGSPRVIVVTDPQAYPGQPRYRPHWADCPGAEKARRRDKPASGGARHHAPPQAETLF